MQSQKQVYVKSTLHFIIGVSLATLFFWTIIEGIKYQTQNNPEAFIFYFLSFMSGIAAVYNYTQAKQLFHYARLA